MKNLKLLRLSILSEREKSARQETFSKTTTVIMGENDTGKSHLIKSIYSSLGADPSVLNEKWVKAKVVLFLDFLVDDSKFSILRVNDHFGIFDANDNLIWAGFSADKGLGPQIARMLNFNIELSAKREFLIIPPPQFYFMPFYQDQDRGWDDTWSSFKNLTMTRDFRKNAIEYHTGIRPREYYLAQAAKIKAVREQSKLKSERHALDRTTDRLRRDRTPLRVSFNPDLFASQLDRILNELNTIKSSYDHIKDKIVQLRSQKILKSEELEIAKISLQELDADVRFVENFSEAQVICPTCHAVHGNDFANRFGLINDADACRSLVADSLRAINIIDEEIKKSFSLLHVHGERIKIINDLLENAQGDIKLRDMLKDESERILEDTISTERSLIDKGISAWKIEEESSYIDMRTHSSQRKKSDIIYFYSKKLREFSDELGIKFDDQVSKSVSPKINETGSYGPRAMLAYHYALLHTIREFTTSCICPIVIDTPLQQDQDKENAQSMIKFALKNRPDDMQLVLGTVSLHGAAYTGHLITPDHKEALLNREDYEHVKALIRPFINKMIGLEQGDLF